MPINKENGGYFLEGFALGKLSFKDIQNFSNLSGVRELYSKLDSSFITDLLSIKINGILMVRNQGYESVDYKDFKLVSLAILNKKILCFDYKKYRVVSSPINL